LPRRSPSAHTPRSRVLAPGPGGAPYTGIWHTFRETCACHRHLSVIVPGGYPPGVLTLHDILRAEIIIQTGTGMLRLETAEILPHYRPRDRRSGYSNLYVALWSGLRNPACSRKPDIRNVRPGGYSICSWFPSL
jgi:hypothetical protein